MKKFELVQKEQYSLREQVIYLKQERGINYKFWADKLSINKATISGWIYKNRNLPKPVADRLEKLLEQYKV